MDKSAFRAAFPEFADTTLYPDGQLDFWAAFAEQMISECRWGTMYANGVFLYVAHQLKLSRANASATGAAALMPQGNVSSKTVGDVSVSYESTNDSSLNAGHWGLTLYGRQYIQLARMFGVGAVQL